MAKKKDPYRYYSRGLGQFRREHGRAKTYLLFLVCFILCKHSLKYTL